MTFSSYKDAEQYAKENGGIEKFQIYQISYGNKVKWQVILKAEYRFPSIK